MAYVFVAYAVTPMFLRLMAQSVGTQVGPEDVGAGRKITMLTSFAAALITIPAGMVRMHSVSAMWERAAGGCMVSLVEAVPYAVMFVGLGMVVREVLDRSEVEDEQGREQEQ
jgi:hypothetical protein